MTETESIAQLGMTLPAPVPGRPRPRPPFLEDQVDRIRLRRGRGPVNLALAVLAATVLFGCNGWDTAPAPPGYLPGWDEARQSLETALDAWRDAPSALPDSIELPGVIFVDKQRPPERRLRTFAILGRSEIENARQFTVRLQLDREESPRLVRYNVIGRNPVWVFRLEDYERISHWEHPMEDAAPPPTAERRGE